MEDNKTKSKTAKTTKTGAKKASKPAVKKVTKTTKASTKKPVAKPVKAAKTTGAKAVLAKTASKTSKTEAKTVVKKSVVKNSTQPDKVIKKPKSLKKSEKINKDSKKSSVQKAKKKDRSSLIAVLITIVVVIVTSGLGIWAYYQRYHEPEPEEIEVIEDEVIEEEEEPEEDLPKEPEGPDYNMDNLVPEPSLSEADWPKYQTVGYKPRFFSIPSLDINNVPIVEVGVTSQGALGSPINKRLVGWYYRSSFPGKLTQGATLMDAHGGDLGIGIFKNLPQAEIGTEIIIEMGNGYKYTYVIKEMVYKHIGNEANSYMPSIFQPLSADTPTLSLITCTGEWIPAQQTYTHRLFVKAALKQ